MQVTALTSYELPYHGHEGYKKAEVTGGGVRLEDLDCSTMESRVGGWGPILNHRRQKALDTTTLTCSSAAGHGIAAPWKGGWAVGVAFAVKSVQWCNRRGARAMGADYGNSAAYGGSRGTEGN